MKSKKLVIFMPSIEGGGVEKNLFIISNFLALKLEKTKLITASRSYNKKFSNLEIINPSLNVEKFKYRRLKYLFCLIELIKILILNRDYVVFAFQANLYCAVICKIFGVKVIVRSNSSPSGWALTPFRKTIFKIFLKIPDRIIVNSFEFKNEYKKLFNINTYCIYNPLNKEEIIKKSKKKINFKYFKNFKKLKIVFIGRLVDQKDPITFIKALNILKDILPFRTLIIGKGILKVRMTKFISKNKLSKNIKFLNWKENPYNYLKCSDILVLTSKYEGLPNVLLEAISLKKFVISTRCKTGPAEILDNGKGGFLFKVGNYKELADKIISYSKSKKFCKLKIIYAFKRLNRFNLNNNLKLYLNIISKELN